MAISRHLDIHRHFLGTCAFTVKKMSGNKTHRKYMAAFKLKAGELSNKEENIKLQFFFNLDRKHTSGAKMKNSGFLGDGRPR